MHSLAGLKVLDFTRLLPGGAATMLLSNFGAQVVKVEEPGKGDYSREMNPKIEGMGAAFVPINRGKRSISVDLKSPEGKDLLLGLARQADIVVESFRPGTMEKLGLGYADLSAINDRIIMLSVSGFGQQGAARDWPGHDLNYLAWSGVLDLLRTPDGRPCIPGIQIADVAGGALGAIGVLLALVARERTGKGQHVDAAITDALLPLLTMPLALHAATGGKGHCAPGSNIFTGRYACYNLYATKDGRWLSVGAFEPKFWRNLCQQLKVEDVVEDQFAEGALRERILARFREVFSSKTAAEWSRILEGKDTSVMLVRTLAEVASDPEFRARKALISDSQVGALPLLASTPGEVGTRAPGRGEHTRTVLREAGFADEEISRWMTKGVLEETVAVETAGKASTN